MLNPLTIESVHYAMYDSMLISSLLLYDKKNIKFLQSELQKRKSILKKHYDLEKYSDGTILFSAIGAPHPYWIDVYPTQLNIYYKNGHHKIREIIPKDFKQKISKRAFIFIDKNESKDIDRIEINQKYNNRNNKLFTTKVDRLMPIDVNTTTLKAIPASKSYFYDLYMENNSTYMKLHKDKTSKALIKYILNTPVDLWEKKYFLVFINNTVALSSLKIVLIDTKGKTSERYYLPQDTGNNLILLSALGFKNQNIDHKIKEIRFYLYSKKNHTKKTMVDFSEIMYIDSNWQLYDLLKQNDENDNKLFKFKEKKPKILKKINSK